MGSARPKPARLANKLLEIRKKLDGGLSQNQMVRRLGLEEEFDQERISKFERGVLEPPLHILCAYADIANVYLDVLARDEIDLPENLPASEKAEGIRRNTRTQQKRLTHRQRTQK
jgi:transcriptional regulator with XRE-family HTH domain